MPRAVTATLRRLSSSSLAAAGALALWSAPARATIVWEGKEVPAWPDSNAPAAAPNGASLQVAGAMHSFPHPSGVVRGLTILVDFSDAPPAYNKAEIDAWLNELGYDGFGLDGSVRDYYLAQSNGRVDYQNEVHGFYRAQKAKSYYQGGTAYERADELWREVITALDAEIDFSKFDNDGDGNTEAVSLLYAGSEGTFGKGLWPHASGSNERHDGVRLARYMMTALRTEPTNYVFAHESGHMLFGWPDLYGVGDYCIMANRGSDKNPVGINDVFRADQAWIEVVDYDASSNARPSALPDGATYRYRNPARPTEYFAWSNVQNTKEWVSLRGGGLLIWHFDQAIGSNTPPAVLELAVVQAAAGSRKLGATTWPEPGSLATDLYSRAVNSEFGPTTQPKSQWNDGSSSGLRVYDIAASGPSMQFSIGTGPLPSGVGGGGAGGLAGAGGASGGGQAGAGGAGTAPGGTPGGGSELSGGGVPTSGGSAAASGGAGFPGGGSGGAELQGGRAAGGVASSSGTAGAGAASSSAGVGNPVAPNPGGAESTEAEASCGCRVGRERPRSWLAWVAGAAVALAYARRRARRVTLTRRG